MQPPSGGCVLKLFQFSGFVKSPLAAAFGRLCVETCVYDKEICFSVGSRLRAAVC